MPIEATSSLPDLMKAETPGLVLDEARMLRNIARLHDRLAPFNVVLFAAGVAGDRARRPGVSPPRWCGR